ncbi:MAG TPA: ABC transporter permease [Burkholderiaceae bacterium]|nr:ABC transporter permease [Burkholderiaceae bacterium]
MARPWRGRAATLAMVALVGAAAGGFALRPAARGEITPSGMFWVGLAVIAVLAASTVRRCAALDDSRLARTLTMALFGAWILYFWQVLVTALDVPKVLLPAPLQIISMFVAQLPVLGRDFTQTVLKSVLAGWALGCGLGFSVGVAIDRLPFLQRGLLPLAALTSTVPLVGVAPIAVMWFGFDWPSKAAVVVLMTFFPMLVATLAGLQAAGRSERELMVSYAAGYGQTLLQLRLPAALPFIFSALKVNATLALIGAIVAEFFGSPTVGLGFRISTEASKMNMPLVWAAIVVASLAGSGIYAILVQVERRVTFWHPSVRG